METKDRNHLRNMVYASMFGALTAIGAFITIPLQPVPFTLQTFFTGVAGGLLGAYTGALSQIIYLFLGFLGLPVFAGGKAGIGVLFGPTGGYLLGFVVGAYVIGKIMQLRPQGGIGWVALAVLAGNLVIYTIGTLQLLLVADLSLIKALMLGVVPFLVGDLVKMAAAVWLIYELRKRLHLAQ